MIDRGVVDGALDNRLNTVEAKSDRIQSENDRLSAENDSAAVVGDLQPFAVSGRLVGDDIGVVAVRGVDGDRTKAVVTAAQQANATVRGHAGSRTSGPWRSAPT